MNVGLVISVLMHATVLALAIFTMARSQPFKPLEVTPVEVAIITDDDLVRLTKGDRSSKQLEAAPSPPAPDSKVEKEVPKPKIVAPPPPPPPPPPPEAKAEPPPPPPPPPKAEEPKPDPIADKLAMLPPDPEPGPDPAELKRQEEEAKKAAEQKKLDEQKRIEELKRKAEAERKKKIEEQKKREEQRRIAEAKKKAEEAKKKSFEEVMAENLKPALKDNDPNKKPPPPGGAQTVAAAKRGPAAGAPEGNDSRLTASQSAMLGLLIKEAVKRCWNVNTGAEGMDKIIVKLEVHLLPDGRLAQPPRVANSMSGPLFADAANSALRAVQQCEPYSFPPELYKNGWDGSIWTFDPRRMF